MKLSRGRHFREGLRRLCDGASVIHGNTVGAEAIEAVMIIAFLVPPVVAATRLIWIVFLRFFSGAAAVINAPLF